MPGGRRLLVDRQRPAGPLPLRPLSRPHRSRVRREGDTDAPERCTHPRTSDRALADRAYTSRGNRRDLRRRGIPDTIPERLDQQRHRKNRGSRGGRPTCVDGERYRKRSTVERTINRLNGFRAVATRYEKRASIYLGTITLAALAIWLRTPWNRLNPQGLLRRQALRRQPSCP
ncbi:transposase [Streptomyces sp. SID9727]|nr:transposase [Streptomyces sp. SID9727]